MRLAFWRTAHPTPYTRTPRGVTHLDVNVWSWISDPTTDIDRLTIEFDRPLPYELGATVTGTVTSITRRRIES